MSRTDAVIVEPRARQCQVLIGAAPKLEASNGCERECACPRLQMIGGRL
jgi:hypothetical protein